MGFFFFFYEPRGSDGKPSKRSGTGGGEPPATGMARDYDYLFKLLIIGDSGKPTPGMQDGKWALPCFFYKCGRTNAALWPNCTTVVRLQLIVFHFLHPKWLVKCTHPPYFCGADRAEVVCPGWACQPFRPDISYRA